MNFIFCMLGIFWLIIVRWIVGCVLMVVRFLLLLVVLCILCLYMCSRVVV